MDRHTSATIAAHTRWAGEADRTQATQAMRDGFLNKLREQAREMLGPNASEAQVQKSADNLLQAHYARMKARRREGAARRRAEAAGDLAAEILTDGAA